ncbi:MAG: 1-deoxy-D-xylulose-5-phosphate reductoisomerase [Betaproteobacteria bacterium TMED41]|nr:MAG: 1-deoxy-D-xylulose-5-phosphate reductoisomerase [Betaproteobacteria bacterium TMED41]
MTLKITILGATGSIGKSTLEIVRQHPDHFKIVGLSTNTNIKLFEKLIKEFRPKKAVIANKSFFKKTLSFSGVKIIAGEEGLLEISGDPDTDVVVAGIVGFAGLSSVMAATRAGKRVLLANKEALVCAGNLMVENCFASNAEIIPIDSEHNAIFQCLGVGYRCFYKAKNLSKVILTASGGPFRTWKEKEIENATVEQAIAHPNWTMGKKISVDSATMINKALEIIEAHWLFNLKSSEIEVVIHPESIIHSMIEFSDKAVLAQLGQPDMRVPIASGLAWPNRLDMDLQGLDWRDIKTFNFESPDDKRFPAIPLAREVLNSGGSLGAVMNAANEVAVLSFLNGDIAFGSIIGMVYDSLEKFSQIASQNISSLDELIILDNSVRQFCTKLIKI